MRFKKVRKILSNNIYYLDGIDGDFMGNFTKEQLKKYNNLYIKCIWTIPEKPRCICLDLVSKEVKS